MNLPNWLEVPNQWAGLLSSVIGIVSAVLAGLIRTQQVREKRMREQPIKLILVNESDDIKRHVLGYRPRRDQATRAEILGILGMYSGSNRFESKNLVPILESKQFDEMIAGQRNELELRVSNDDFGRFVRQDHVL